MIYGFVDLFICDRIIVLVYFFLDGLGVCRNYFVLVWVIFLGNFIELEMCELLKIFIILL